MARENLSNKMTNTTKEYSWKTKLLMDSFFKTIN